MAYTILIPSRNIDNLMACVGALRAAGETGRVIVLWDDGFELPMMQRRRELEALDVTILHCDTPFCFARNCNIGIRAAAPDGVVLLNDDALLDPACGFYVLQSFDFLRKWGVTGATTNVTGHREQMRLGVFGQACGMREVRRIAFVCVYIPRCTLDAVGLLDERFCGPGVYGGEDVDYCLRVQQAGLKVGVSDLCFVDHAKLKSTFRGAHPTNGAPGDIRESNRIGREKWGNKWPKLGA
jgi:GT2 family glycosyltransferase